MDRVIASIEAVSEWTGRVFSVTVLLATVVVAAEVVMRYGFNSPTAWGFELPIYFAGASYLLSGAYAHLHDGHVRVDLLYSRWSPRTQAIVDVVTSPVFFLGVGVLLWMGAEWTWHAFDRGITTGTRWNPPMWPIRLLVPVGALLLFAQGVARLLRDLRVAFGRVDA